MTPSPVRIVIDAAVDEVVSVRSPDPAFVDIWPRMSALGSVLSRFFAPFLSA